MQFTAAWPTESPIVVYAEASDFKVSEVIVCRSFFSRARGLLGYERLAANAGMLLVPCKSIHTVAMKFAIDIVYLDSSGTVLSTQAELSPHRFSRGPRGTHAVLEVASGAAQSLSVGQRLAWLSTRGAA